MRIIDNIQGLSSMILILMLDVISGINAFANRMWLALGRTNQRCIIMLVPYSRYPLLVGGLLLITGSGLFANEEPTPLELFDERIRPIFQSEDPSSCVQCHLSSVDLKDYILPSHQQTFASLNAQGLIDLRNPAKSQILKLIQMGEKDSDEGAKLIHEKTRKAEHKAFVAWIEACCKDPALVKLTAPESDTWAKPDRPDTVIRHTRKSRVVDSFARSIWSQRMRCFPCHTPFELDESNPKHLGQIKKVAEFKGQFGQDHAQRLRLFKKSPEETLKYWIERSRQVSRGNYPLINIKEPRHSLILLKPTSRLPEKVNGIRKKASNADPVSHMGGLKMHVDDQSYKAFVAWLEDYARVVGGTYQSVEELPRDNWYPSKHMVIIEDAPKEWPDQVRVQLFVHAWDESRSTWEQEPIAFTQNSLTPKRRVAGALFLLRPQGAERAWHQEEETLPDGRYLLKVYVDSKQRLKNQPAAMLSESDFYGQTTVLGPWTKTFKDARKVAGDQFSR